MAAVSRRARARSAVGRLLRRGTEVVVSGLALVLLTPLLAGIAIWIRIDSPGPVLFRQERVGLNRTTFTLYKFRSMYVGVGDEAHRRLIQAELAGADTMRGGSCKIGADPRLTPAGGWLRRTSLDELPQLINVFLGHMALVGPRPCLPWEAEMFPARFAARFTVRPGLTGLWQISGRSTMGTLEMLELDLEYVRTRGPLRDLVILLATPFVLLRGDGAR